MDTSNSSAGDAVFQLTFPQFLRQALVSWQMRSTSSEWLAIEVGDGNERSLSSISGDGVKDK